MLSTAHFGQSIPSVHSAYPIDFSRPTHARSAESLPQSGLKPGAKLNKAIHDLLGNAPQLDRKTEKQIIGLACQLIATRHLLHRDTSLPASQLRTFHWRSPIRDIRFSKRGVQYLLQVISPSLAENSIVTEGIRDIANLGKAGESFREYLKNSPLKDLNVNARPEQWSREDILYLLRIGQWNEINLDGIDLENADLSGIDLRGAKIRDANLHNVDCTGCQMEGIDLTGSNITCGKFSLANLHGAILTSVKASLAKFTGAVLTGIQADKDAFFLQSDFSHAQTEKAILTNSHLEYSQGLSLRHTTMTNAEIRHANMTFTMKDRDYRDLDGFTAGQLHTVETISPGNEDVQIALLKGLIEGSNAEHDRLKDIGQLAKTLLTLKACWKDEQLRKFIDGKLLRTLLHYWNTSKENRFGLSPQNVLAYIVHTRPALNWPEYGGAISQMLVAAEANQRIPQRDALCELLLTDPTISSLNTAMEELGLTPFNDHCIFVAPGRREAVVYPNSLIFEMLKQNGSPFQGNRFTHNAEGKFTKQPLQSLDAIERCGVPTELFYIDPAPLAALRLIEYIFPNNRYQKALKESLTSISLSMRPELMNPRTGQRDHYALAEDLGKFLRGVGGTSFIDFEEAKNLRQTVVDSGIELKNDDSGKTDVLLCLSALSLGAASPDLVGSKPALKKSLEEFSAACIRSASLLDKNLLPDAEKEVSRSVEPDGTFSRIIQSPNLSKYTDEKDRESALRELLNLIGRRSASDPQVERCFKAIFPQAWIPEPAHEIQYVAYQL